MNERRPYLLTDGERANLAEYLRRGRDANLDGINMQLLLSAALQLEVVPEPWLTVDDQGRAVRMVNAGSFCPTNGQPTSIHHADAVTLYRAAPTDPEGL